MKKYPTGNVHLFIENKDHLASVCGSNEKGWTEAEDGSFVKEIDEER